MTVDDTVLALYRAAREFTRRVTGVETLERAALDYARARGWTPPGDYISTPIALTEREITANLRTRVSMLESAIRAIAEQQNEGDGAHHTLTDAINNAREVLE